MDEKHTCHNGIRVIVASRCDNTLNTRRNIGDGRLFRRTRKIGKGQFHYVG